MHNSYKLAPIAFFALISSAIAQVPLPSTLVIQVENYVEYFEDTSDPFKKGTDPNITTVNAPLLNTFLDSDHFADIISINGQPAKGLLYGSGRVIGSATTLTPGHPIADVTTSTYRTYYFQLQNGDGMAIGTIISSGPASQPPPGAVSGVTAGDFVIVGGTGAFLGARGQAGFRNNGSGFVAGRLASASEDPSRRRINGGGKRTLILSIYPSVYPQILISNGLPAVTHASDFTLVTASKPAAGGEILAAFATGLGPTRPGVEPGLPFPQSPLAVVSSPVQITVGGKSAEILSAVGYPGATYGYQVNFRMPEGVAKGNAEVLISSAWIGGAAPVLIPVQ